MNVPLARHCLADLDASLGAHRERLASLQAELEVRVPSHIYPTHPHSLRTARFPRRPNAVH